MCCPCCKFLLWISELIYDHYRILHSFSVVQLLRPLLDHPQLTSASIGESIWKYAQQGLILIDEHYRRLYTCRYQPVSQMFVVLHLCDLVVRSFPSEINFPMKDRSETVRLGIRVFEQSRFPIAGILQDVLYRTAIEQSIQLPRTSRHSKVSTFDFKPQVFRMNKVIDACTRLEYAQPVSAIQSRIVLNVDQHLLKKMLDLEFKIINVKSITVQNTRTEEESAIRRSMQVSNMLNIN
jgi:hypothetical protein